ALQNMGRILHLAAAGAGQVAAEERLEHEHRWIALDALELLLPHIAGNRPHLGDRDGHKVVFPQGRWPRNTAFSYQLSAFRSLSCCRGSCPIFLFSQLSVLLIHPVRSSRTLRATADPSALRDDRHSRMRVPLPGGSW